MSRRYTAAPTFLAMMIITAISASAAPLDDKPKITPDIYKKWMDDHQLTGPLIGRCEFDDLETTLVRCGHALYFVQHDLDEHIFFGNPADSQAREADGKLIVHIIHVIQDIYDHPTKYGAIPWVKSQRRP
jgi:hypothetical protein